MSNFRRMLLNSKPQYTVLEYLESTGTQYITTDYILKYNSVIDCDFAFTAVTGTSRSLFGYRQGAFASGSVYWIGKSTNSSNIFARLGTGNDGESSCAFTKDTFFNLQIKSDHCLYFNNQKVGDNFIVADTTFGPLWLFCVNTAGTADFVGQSRLRYFRAFEDGQLVLDLIPVLDSNGVPCLYDRVNNKFYYNQGTGEFSYKEWNNTSITYIGSTGTQYIDTNAFIDGNYTIKATVNPLNIGGFYYWGCGAYQSKSVTYNLWPVNSGGASVWGSAMFTFYYSSLIANEFNSILQNKDGVYVNGKLIRSYVGGTSASSYTMWLFKGNRNNASTDSYNSGSMEVRDFSLLDGNNQLMVNLKPVIDENGVLGFYDTVRNQILYNAGTGDFQGYIETGDETYQIVNYIESNGTQRIGLPISGNARWIITAQGASITNSSKVLITSTDYATADTWYGENVSGGNWGSGADADSGIPVTTKATADLTFTNNGVSGTVNGISISRSASTTQGSWSMFRGAIDYVMSVKVFGAKVYQNNQLVLNLLPATRMSDNKVGLYDTVTNSFFVDDNGGTFTMG